MARMFYTVVSVAPGRFLNMHIGRGWLPIRQAVPVFLTCPAPESQKQLGQAYWHLQVRGAERPSEDERQIGQKKRRKQRRSGSHLAGNALYPREQHRKAELRDVETLLYELEF